MGAVKVLGEGLAPPPNHLFVTWIMKKIAVFSLFPKNQGDSEKIGDFLHYFSRYSHIQGGKLRRPNTPEQSSFLDAAPQQKSHVSVQWL